MSDNKLEILEIIERCWGLRFFTEESISEKNLKKEFPEIYRWSKKAQSGDRYPGNPSAYVVKNNESCLLATRFSDEEESEFKFLSGNDWKLLVETMNWIVESNEEEGQRSTIQVIGADGSLKSIMNLIEKISNADATVLIQGENGTGKEVMAKKIHQNSKRSSKLFLAINCGAIPKNLIESELFGHEKGAFTGADQDKKGFFAKANGGTLFLDEVGELPLEAQTRFLRVLQEGTFQRVGSTLESKSDVRIIAATNRNLEEMIKNKEFRQDLYYRLNVIQMTIPPLRERREDFDLFLNSFVDEFYEETEVKYSDDVNRIFQAYSWPGNIRQLRNEIEQLSVTVKSGQIEKENLSPHILNSKEIKELFGSSKASLKKILERNEIEMIREGLHRLSGNKVKLAKEMGISPRSLESKIKKYEIAS